MGQGPSVPQSAALSANLLAMMDAGKLFLASHELDGMLIFVFILFSHILIYNLYHVFQETVLIFLYTIK